MISEKPKFLAYLSTLLITLFSFLILGALPLVICIALQRGGMQVLETFSTTEIVKLLGLNLYFAMLLMPFVFGTISLIYCHKYILKLPVLSLFTSRQKFDFRRFFTMFFLWLFIQLSFLLYNFIFNDYIVWNFSAFDFFILLLICITIVPFQIAFEELFFRSFLVDFFRTRINNNWMIILLTSVVFGWMHYDNPEMDAIGNYMMIFYISLGIIMAMLAVFDKGIELSLGFHFANNLVPFLIITNSWQAVQSDALLLDTEQPAISWIDWLTLFILLPLIFLLMKFLFNIKIKTIEDN